MSQLWITVTGGAPQSYLHESGLHLPVPGLHPRRHTTLVPIDVLGSFTDPYDHRGIEREVEHARRQMGADSDDPEGRFMAWQRDPRHARLAPVRMTRTTEGRLRLHAGREYVHAAAAMELNPSRLEGFHALPTEITDMRHPGRTDRMPTLYHGTSVAGLTQIHPAIGHVGLEYAKYHSPEADHHFAYATANLEEATNYARGHAAVHDTEPIVYRVRPRGPIELDPPHNPADILKLNERSADVRTPHGFDVEEAIHPGWG